MGGTGERQARRSFHTGSWSRGLCSSRRLDRLGRDAANAKSPLPVTSSPLSPVPPLASSWLDSLFCLGYKLISISPSKACWAFMRRGTGSVAEAMAHAHCHLFCYACFQYIHLVASFCFPVCDCLCSAIVWPLILTFQWQGQFPLDN